MTFLRLNLKLDIKQRDPNRDLRAQYSRPTLTPPTASTGYGRSSPPPRPRQGIPRSYTAPIPRAKPQNSQQTPMRHGNPNSQPVTQPKTFSRPRSMDPRTVKRSDSSLPPRSRQGIPRSHTTPNPRSKSENSQQAPARHGNPNSQPVTQPKTFSRPRSMDPRTVKRSNSCPPPRPKTFFPPPPFKQQQRQYSIASSVTIDSYWSLEGLPSTHEHRRIRRSQTDNIAKVSTWMDNHKGLARGRPMDSRTPKCIHSPKVQSSRRAGFFHKEFKTGNHDDSVECHGPARVMVPGGRPENHYVAYFGAKAAGKMYRARYHSYSKALENPDRRVKDQFQQKYLRFFGK